MELDEFKKHWNNIQDKEISKQKYTTDNLDHIIMKATNTLNELHKKSMYWNNLGKAVCSTLIGALLVNLAIAYFLPTKSVAFSGSVLYVAILIGFAVITMWASNKQQQIFFIGEGQNLKEALQKTLADFKRFYIVFNLIYVFVYPAYFYAMINLFFSSFALSAAVVAMICAGGTIIALIAGHLYYRVKYAEKLKSLETNLHELEGE